MIKVIVIGSGNVAQHLILAFAKSTTATLIQIYSRQKETLTHLLDSSKITTSFNELLEADLYIIAVSDDAIDSVSAQLPFINRLVVHTSGSVALNALDNKNRKGVLYPLQTFSKGKPMDFSTVPICIESENSNDFQLLDKAAKSISDAVFAVNTDQRKALHVAAVFVNNFVNNLYQIGKEICEEHQVPFDILKPLILETANKIMTLSPEDAQTGPAKRNDLETIASHLSLLSNKNQATIYKILTQSIQDNGTKL
ncbi:DUF2520 domain-containing protein [Flavobacterium sp.]|uniref:Rossmann-like and DUF2520 domain-containing protein n=1 Tax=Flavobacterium sp. TaxID=239 RepID=UPI00286B954F|nr:DUF2520 domain-containing protein [Flavobacterium sp.]